MFLKVSTSTRLLRVVLLRVSKKLEYNGWKLGSIDARFMTRYWAAHGM